MISKFNYCSGIFLNFQNDKNFILLFYMFLAGIFFQCSNFSGFVECSAGKIVVERRNYFPEMPVKLGGNFHLGSFFDRQMDKMATLDRLGWLMKLNNRNVPSSNSQQQYAKPAQYYDDPSDDLVQRSPQAYPGFASQSGAPVAPMLRMTKSFNKRPNMRLRLGTVSRRKWWNTPDEDATFHPQTKTQWISSFLDSQLLKAPSKCSSQFSLWSSPHSADLC